MGCSGSGFSLGASGAVFGLFAVSVLVKVRPPSPPPPFSPSSAGRDESCLSHEQSQTEVIQYLPDSHRPQPTASSATPCHPIHVWDKGAQWACYTVETYWRPRRYHPSPVTRSGEAMPLIGMHVGAQLQWNLRKILECVILGQFVVKQVMTEVASQAGEAAVPGIPGGGVPCVGPALCCPAEARAVHAPPQR